MDNEQSRREFIRSLAMALITGGTVGLDALSALAAKPRAKSTGSTRKPPVVQSKPHYKVSPWQGDDFVLGHKFRVGDVPSFPASPERQVDFVIIGGGIAGLTTAHYLRNENFLLLEQYSDLGGQSRGGSFRGIDYSYGAAYVDIVEGIYGELYRELGIEPVKLPAGDNSFYWNKKWYQGISGKDANVLYANFKRLTADCAAGIKILPTEDTPQAMAEGELARLDSIPFASMLKGYPAQFMALLDAICRSGCCANVTQLSALAGLYLVEDLSSANYVFKGGNPAIARALTKSISAAGCDRALTNAFVWRVELDDSGANVMYTTAEGAPHTVRCKQVIVCTPPMVAWRQVKNMSNALRALLMPMRYGSYLVANCLLSKKIFTSSYDNWFSSPFTIADIAIAETPYIRTNSYKPEMGSVLTVYQPWEPGSAGRTLLLQGDRPKMAGVVHDELKQFLSDLDKYLEEIVLARWGHAMVVAGPGYFARLLRIANAQTGPLILAHNSMQGLPCAESAIRAARLAATKAKEGASRTTMTVPAVPHC